VLKQFLLYESTLACAENVKVMPMNTNEMEEAPLAELRGSQQRVIAEFRCRESEKAGRDIGCQAAADRWFDECFADWVRDERQAIDEVLANAVPRVALPWRQTDPQSVLVHA